MKADALGDAARQLAQKITIALPPYVPSFLTVENLSSLSEGQVSSVRSALQAALRNAGFSLLSDSHSLGQIHVTLSESLAGYVWIAEVRRGEAYSVLIMSIDAAKLQRIQPPASLAIRREFVLEDKEPILDVAFLAAEKGTSKMALLESGQVSFHQPQGEQWVSAGGTRLPRVSPLLRDARGVLYLEPDVTVASFPNETCRLQGLLAKDGTKCEATKAHQPLSSNLESRVADKKNPPWFSATSFETDGNSAIGITGVDGRTRIYEEGPEPIATVSGWGSEIASVQSGCGSGWQLLVTGKGDWTAPDTMQAYEIRDHQALAVSAATEFSGPVTALHSSEDFKTAIAVVKNLMTHHYEAYRLSITCER